jgi:hypothetical protein
LTTQNKKSMAHSTLEDTRASGAGRGIGAAIVAECSNLNLLAAFDLSRLVHTAFRAADRGNVIKTAYDDP